MKDEQIHQHYGRMVWRFIPYHWNQWRIEPVKEEFPEVYNDNISIQMPVPIFKDRNFEIEEWNRDIEIYPIPRLETACKNI